MYPLDGVNFKESIREDPDNQQSRLGRKAGLKKNYT